MESTRVDKWLWGVRVYKTRSAATAACTAGHVDVGGTTAKPAATVRVGDRVTVRIGGRDLVDGGVVNNTPLSYAVELGATEVWVLPTGGGKTRCALALTERARAKDWAAVYYFAHTGELVTQPVEIG